jgi:hypothetical protein
VGLDVSEMQTLKELAVKNDTIKNILDDFKIRAEKAMDEEPNPIEKIDSEGLLAGNPLKVATLKAVEDVSKVYALAIAYRLTDRSKYLKKATDFLLAWAKTNKANGNPINETKLEDLIVGYDFIRESIENENRDLIDAWLKTIADAEVNSKYAEPKRGTSKNNWNSHRIKIVTLIAYTIHDKNYEDFIKSELEAQIAKNLNPDGSSIDFEDRDALHYHIYDLEPLLQTVIAINRATGENYYTYKSVSGSSIEKSVKFLAPFVSGEKTHIEFLNSKTAFDKARAANNEKGYQPANFKPSTGIYALSLAAYFDKIFLDAIKSASKNGMELNWQLLLNTVRKPVE